MLVCNKKTVSHSPRNTVLGTSNGLTSIRNFSYIKFSNKVVQETRIKFSKKTKDLFCEVKQINEKYKPTYNSANGENTSDRSLARIPQIEVSSEYLR